VVLPVPGGPHKIKEESASLSIINRIGFPFPKRCSCPKKELRFTGLILSANGIFIFD